MNEPFLSKIQEVRFRVCEERTAEKKRGRKRKVLEK